MSRSTARKWRLNTRAAIALGALLGVGLPVVVALSYYRGLSSPQALLRQARAQAEADPPQHDLALSYLNEYLEALPAGDPRGFEALVLKSEILEEVGRGATDLREAARACQLALVIANAPGSPIASDGPEAQELRRRQVRTTLALTRFLGANTPLGAAVVVARELVDLGGDRDGAVFGPDDGPDGTPQVDDPGAPPEDLRLLARALEYQAQRGGDEEARAQAVALLRAAAEADPTDLAGAEQLAATYQFHLRADDPETRRDHAAKAEQALDDLLAAAERARDEAATPEARAAADERLAGAHLVRFRHWVARAAAEPSQAARNELSARAGSELARALEVRPEDTEVLLSAVQHALRRGDVDAARATFDRLPADVRQGLRGRLYGGLIDLARNRPDAAIEGFRSGLEASGGSDADLTWQLAYILTDLGRLDEAEPLIRQHRRLIGGEEPDARHRLLAGRYHLAAGEPDEALEQLRPARFQADGDDERFLAQILEATASAHALKGELDEALAMYREASRARPQWVTPHLRRAALLQRAGRPGDALAELDAGLLDLPDDPDLLVARARALMVAQQQLPDGRRDWSEIEKTLDAARAVAPDAAGLARTDADLKLLQGDPNAAAALLAEAVRHDPGAAELWVAWAGVLARMNQPEQALIVLEQGAAPAAAGDSAPMRIARARLLAATGRGQQAREVLTRNLEALPGDDQASLWAELGRQLRDRGQLDEARDAYARWAGLRPADPRPLVAQVELAHLLGDRATADALIARLDAMGGNAGVYATAARAQELLRTAVDGPDDARLDEADRLIAAMEADANSRRAAALLRGAYHERREAPEEAIAAYEQALDLGAGSEAATRLIALYARDGRLDDLEALRRRMATDLASEAAGDAGAFARLEATALLREGRTEEAEALARQVAAGDPESLDARLWEARVLNTAGKPEEAEATLRDLAESSTEPGPWLALLFFQVGRDQHDKARATIDQIRQRVQTEQPALLLGQCYRILGDDEAAEQALRDARAAAPGDPAPARALASFYEATGRPDEAAALLREVLQADPDARWAARSLALLLSQRPGGWDEAWQLADAPEGDERRNEPEERLTRALVLARGTDAPRGDQAVALLEGLVEDLPADNNVARAAREALIRAYAARGQTAKLAELTAPGAANASNPQAIAIHAEVLIRNGQVEEARRQLARLERAAPGQIVTDKLRALVLRAEDQPRAAAESLLEAFEAHRGDPDGGRAAGREFLDLLGVRAADAPRRAAPLADQGEVAEQLARRVAEAFPPDAWRLGRVLADGGRPEEALDAAQVAAGAEGAELRDLREAASLAVNLAVPPDAPEARRRQADAVLEAARAQAPRAPELMILQGYLRHAQGRYEDEVALYRQARELDPDGPALYLNNLAWALALELDRPEEALGVIDDLLASLAGESRYDGVRVQCLDTRGMVLLALGRADEAVAALEEALRGSPENPVYLFHLARAHAAAGRADEARAHLDRAEQAGLDPAQLEPSERAALEQLREG